MLIKFINLIRREREEGYIYELIFVQKYFVQSDILSIKFSIKYTIVYETERRENKISAVQVGSG